MLLDGNHYGGRVTSLVVLGIVLAMCNSSPAAAADSETREFVVSIDGKKAGEFHMSVKQQDDGTMVMNGHADVKISYLVYNYTYSYRGTEIWKDGRLQRLFSNANDNGKKLSVMATGDGDSLRITANGQQRKSRPDLWTTTYWHLVDAKFRNRGVPLLDADTGKEIAANLQHVGTSQINVNGSAQNCAHYRVTGRGVQADLWYDSQERLVRQESIEDGHKTLLELSRIRR